MILCYCVALTVDVVAVVVVVAAAGSDSNVPILKQTDRQPTADNQNFVQKVLRPVWRFNCILICGQFD